MIKIYIDYWKKSFTYTADVSIREFLVSVTFNFLILAIIIGVGMIIPVTLENALMDFWYLILYLMFIPTLSLFTRIFVKVYKRHVK